MLLNADKPKHICRKLQILSIFVSFKSTYQKYPRKQAIRDYINQKWFSYGCGNRTWWHNMQELLKSNFIQTL